MRFSFSARSFELISWNVSIAPAAGSFSCCASSGTLLSRNDCGSVMLARGNWRSFSTTDQLPVALLPAASSALTRMGGGGGAAAAAEKVADGWGGARAAGGVLGDHADGRRGRRVGRDREDGEPLVRIAGARTRHALVEPVGDLHAVARGGLGDRVGDRSRAAALDVGEAAGDRDPRRREVDGDRHL